MEHFSKKFDLRISAKIQTFFARGDFGGLICTNQGLPPANFFLANAYRDLKPTNILLFLCFRGVYL